jgi:heme exporter protein A
MMWQGLVLEAKSLACERGGKLIFKDLNFNVSSGEAVELRGPNGAGKSSLLRLLAGLNQPAAGTLTFSIQPPVIPSLTRHSGASRNLAQSDEDPGLRRDDDDLPNHAHYIGHHEAVKSALTVRQNLDFWSRFLGTEGKAALGPFRLEQLAEDEARLLSEGQRRRLALSRLVSVLRPVWLLDEPTVGLDHAALADLRREMQSHLASGGMIIAATHAELGLKKAHVIEIARAA